MTGAWQKALKEFLAPSTLFVGIGNRLRGDDAFGPALIERLHGLASWPLLDAGETPENYIGRVLSFRPEQVLLFDAVRWAGAPGAIGFFQYDEIPWEGGCTHAASLRLFAEALYVRGKCVTALLGAEPRNLEFGAQLSVDMEQSVEAVAAYIKGLDIACSGMMS